MIAAREFAMAPECCRPCMDSLGSGLLPSCVPSLPFGLARFPPCVESCPQAMTRPLEQVL
jgi:hypothetical protein